MGKTTETDGDKLMRNGRVLVLPAQNVHEQEKTYPLYNNLWLGWCRVSIMLHFFPLHLYLLISPSFS